MFSLVEAFVSLSIEGIPLITRFKTKAAARVQADNTISIEGIPLITRFKTQALTTINTFIKP